MNEDINVGGVLEALNSKVDLDGGNHKPKVVSISDTSGEINLFGNKVYSMTVSDTTAFKLPENVEENVFLEINVLLTVVGTPTIDWGTGYFFYGRTPDIEEGNYDVYYNYDSVLGTWICGVMSKKVVL